MTRKKLLLADTGDIQTVAHFNDFDGEFIIDHHMPNQVVKGILDQNHADRRAGHNPRAKGRHVARIPTLWYERWKKEWEANWKDVMSWQDYMVRELNSSENKFLRTGAKHL